MIAWIVTLIIVLYEILVVAVMVFGWFPVVSRHRLYRRVAGAVEPIFAWLRSQIPLRGGGVDFSPLLLILLLELFRRFLTRWLPL